MAGLQRSPDHLGRLRDVQAALRFGDATERHVGEVEVIGEPGIGGVVDRHELHPPILPARRNMPENSAPYAERAEGGPMSIATLPAPGGAPGALAPALDAAELLLRGRRVAVLTGAGISTDSGIPDYRGTGAPVHRTPMDFSAFLGDEHSRKRYWAGATSAGTTSPPPHRTTATCAVAALERSGSVLRRHHPERRRAARAGRLAPGRRTARCDAAGELPHLRSDLRPRRHRPADDRARIRGSTIRMRSRPDRTAMCRSTTSTR